MKVLETYFTLDFVQRERFSRLTELYGYWNEKINVISRKDIDSLMIRHVLHSLAIAQVCEFAPGARIADVGCGGGFPSVPLAILFPECHFTAVDSIGKKIKVVTEVAKALELNNLTPVNDRIENVDQKFDFIVSRAVTAMPQFVKLVWNKLVSGNDKGSLANGILYLKGGDLAEELAGVGRKCSIWDISQWFDDEFFETKKVVYIKK
jgi:16S rRNA (guanine527-N7)-methyltransferase